MVLIHASRRKINHKIYKIRQIEKIYVKPVGLWYAENELWLKIARDEMNKPYSLADDYFYKIELKYTDIDNPDKRRVLKISTNKDFDRFTFKYGGFLFHKYGKHKHIYILINWFNVSKDYGGIEITSYLKDRRRLVEKNKKKYEKKFMIKEESCAMLTWFTTFDIPSGCVWNPKAIKSFSEIDFSLEKN